MSRGRARWRGIKSSYRAGPARQAGLVPARRLTAVVFYISGPRTTWDPARLPASRLCFFGQPIHEIKTPRMKPFSPPCEDVRNTALWYQMVNETTGRKGPRQGTVMIKAVSAIAIPRLLPPSLSILPGLPQVEASVPQALAKGDRAGHPPGWPRLLAAGLAEFRSFLPARRPAKTPCRSGKPGW